MKVLLVSHTADLNGAERSLLDLAVGLQKCGLDCMVLCPEDGPLTQKLAGKDIPFKIKKLYRPQRNLYKLFQFLLFWLPLVFSLSVWMRQNHFTAIYNNTIDGLYAPFSARLARIPCVWHVREVKPKQPGLRVLFTRLLNLLPDQVVFNSSATMQAYGMAVNKRCHVIYNGIETSGIKVKTGVTNEAVVVGFAGQMVLHKRPDRFLRIIAGTQQEILGLRAVMAGNGILLEDMEQLAQHLHIEDRVEMWGYVDLMDEFYEQIDLLVLTSDQEPFGRVLVEAMVRKIPVVAASVGGVPEVVRDGVTGYLVPVNDLKAYVDKVTKLAMNPDLQRQMGQAGRDNVLAHFTVDVYRQQLVTLLTDVSK